MHYDDATLRAAIDAPNGTDPAMEEHLASCGACRARRDELAINAAFAGRVLSEPAPYADAAAGYERARARARTGARLPAWAVPAMGLGAAACLVLVLAFTPLGGLAGQLLTVFEPQQFVALSIAPQDREQMRLVPQLQRFGTFASASPAPKRELASLAQAGPALGFEPRSFDYAAPGPRPTASYYVMAPYAVQFTFSAAKARAYEARFKRALPPMPAALDGTTFRATYGPTLLREYSTGSPGSAHVKNERRDGDLVFIESRAPRVTSTGASLEDAANYLLAMPNVPPSVAAQLRAISDPSHTLPIPIVFDKATSTPVTIDGVRGLAVGDETGVGSAVMWSKNGIVYVVAGALKESEVLALAGGVK